jgi:hypothetical protein
MGRSFVLGRERVNLLWELVGGGNNGMMEKTGSYVNAVIDTR